MLNLLFLADWSPPEVVARRGGPVDRRFCHVLKESFWKAWRLDKEGMRAAGVAVYQGEAPGTYFAVWESPHGSVDGQAKLDTKIRKLPLHPSLEGKMFPWQPEPISILAASVAHHGAALDASGTGTGKTTAALGVALSSGLQGLFVICPINVIPAWEDWGLKFGLPVVAMNPEKLVLGKTKWVERKRKTYTWKIPPKWGVAVDEAHRMGGLDTLLARVGRAAHDQGIPIAFLSATIADSPLRLSTVGEALGLFRREEYWDWAVEHGCTNGKYGWEFSGSTHAMNDIKAKIFGVGKGVKLNPSQIPGFPKVQIAPMMINVGKSANAIEERYRSIISKSMALGVKGSDRKAIRKSIQQEWKEIEMAKLPAAIERMKDAIAEGNSSILFTRFRQTALMAHTMIPSGLIIGEQNVEKERRPFIKSFQEDQLRAMVATGDCGGEGISLHDVRGEFPREVDIFPPWSSRVFRQMVGRGWRGGAKSACIVRILVAIGTQELDLVHRLTGKLNSLDALTDMDFAPGKSPDTRALLAALESEESDEN